MAFFRRGRFLYWLARELGEKYTKALVAGFVVGLALSLASWKLYPIVARRFLTPVERIGIVGEFTPSTLPLPIQKQISSGLTDIGEDQVVLPALASSWEATDSGKTFTFHLRDDMVWHNNKPVTSQDVNYNIRNVTFTAIDNRTLRATLNDPYSPFPTLVTKPIFLAGLRGFGPFRVGSIRLKGDKVNSLRLVPVANPQGKIREYRFFRTEATAILAYKLGMVDIIEDIGTLQDLATWGPTTVETHIKYDRIVSLFFNVKNQLLAEKPVRQALAYAVPNLEEERALGPIPKTSWAYTDKVRRYTHDPAQTKRLLTAAKIASDSGTLTISTFSQYVDVAQAIADSWSEQGMSTDVKVVTEVAHDYQVLLSAQDVPPDPDQYPFWHSTQGQTNVSGYNNPKIDKLLEDGRQELDAEKRRTLYTDFQRRLVEDAPAVFLYYAKTYTIKRK